MKTITIISALFLFASCEKNDPTCKICEEKVNYQTLGVSQYYIESSTEYCSEADWQAVDGKVVKASGTNQGQWWKKTTTTTCHNK